MRLGTMSGSQRGTLPETNGTVPLLCDFRHLPTTGVMFTGSRSVPVVGGGHSWQLLSPLCGKGGEMEVCATQPRLSVNGPPSYLPWGRLR